MAVYVSNYSSTQQQVSWDTPGGAYTHTQLQRSTNGGGYVTVSISGMSWFPIGTRLVRVNCAAGNSYRYRVKFRYTSQLGTDFETDYTYSSTLVFQPPGGGYVPPDPHDPTPPDPGGSSNPPTGLKITSLSDSSISLSWTNNGSYSYLVMNIQVNGVHKSDLWWTNNPTTYTDTAQPKANQLMTYYLLIVINPGPGETYKYSNTVHIRTTPAAPVNAKAEKYGNRGIRASWGRSANWDKMWQWLDIQRQEGGGSWVSYITGLAPDVTALEDYEIHPGRLYRYRVRARANTGSFERVSAWATTGYVRLMSISPKIGETYKDGELLALKVGSQWREADGVWLNVGGVWVPV